MRAKRIDEFLKTENPMGDLKIGAFSKPHIEIGRIVYFLEDNEDFQYIKVYDPDDPDLFKMMFYTDTLAEFQNPRNPEDTVRIPIYAIKNWFPEYEYIKYGKHLYKL